MPLVRPSTAEDFCFCMVATSTATLSTRMPCLANECLASAYMWLDCSRACRQPEMPLGLCMASRAHQRSQSYLLAHAHSPPHHSRHLNSPVSTQPVCQLALEGIHLHSSR